MKRKANKERADFPLLQEKGKVHRPRQGNKKSADQNQLTLLRKRKADSSKSGVAADVAKKKRGS